MGNRTNRDRVRRIATIGCALLAFTAGSARSQQTKVGQPPKALEPPIPVRFTDVRQAAGINFLQDSTQTDEKYYLETMGTGVGRYDQEICSRLDEMFDLPMDHRVEPLA